MAFPKLDVVSSLADAYSKDGTDALIVIGHFDTIDDSALAEKIQQAKTCPSSLEYSRQNRPVF